MENNKDLKYQYHVYTWGGFYNEEYQKVHRQERGDHWFDTMEERQIFIEKLQSIEKLLKANHLCFVESEGYTCNIHTELHRVTEWDGKRYYTKNDLGINFRFEGAKYIMEHKWYPGCNDYPLGEDFDYDKNEVKIIQEWITGACHEDESIFERQ